MPLDNWGIGVHVIKHSMIRDCSCVQQLYWTVHPGNYLNGCDTINYSFKSGKCNAALVSVHVSRSFTCVIVVRSRLIVFFICIYHYELILGYLRKLKLFNNKHNQNTKSNQLYWSSMIIKNIYNYYNCGELLLVYVDNRCILTLVYILA